MIWNAAIYWTLVVQDVVIGGLRRTLVLRASAKQGSCYALGRMTLRYKLLSARTVAKAGLLDIVLQEEEAVRMRRRGTAGLPRSRRGRVDRGSREKGCYARFRSAAASQAPTIRPSSGSERACIFRIALLRWTFTVASAMPISPAICLLRRPRATSIMISRSLGLSDAKRFLRAARAVSLSRWARSRERPS